MAAITVTAALVAPVLEVKPDIKGYIAAVALTRGQAVYLNTSGKAALARANAVATSGFIGIAMNPAGPGQAVDVLMRGSVAGFDLTTPAYNGLVYLSSAIAGGLDTAAATGTGNVVVPVGRILSMADGSKVLFMDVPILASYTALP